jgi:hypothetical protein
MQIYLYKDNEIPKDRFIYQEVLVPPSKIAFGLIVAFNLVGCLLSIPPYFSIFTSETTGTYVFYLITATLSYFVINAPHNIHAKTNYFFFICGKKNMFQFLTSG